MTDHGNIYGAVHFFDAAKGRASSPSSAASSTSARRTTIAPSRKATSTTTCWCWPRTKRAIATWSASPREAALHGFYRKPRVSKDFLAKHTEGLIGFSGCLAGEVCAEPDGREVRGRPKRPPASTRTSSAKGTSSSRSRTTGWSRTKKSATRLFRMEKELDIPLIATNDIHYHCEDDHRAHEILLCVQTAGIDERSQALQVRHAGVLHQVCRGDGAALCARARSRAAAPCSLPSAAI